MRSLSLSLALVLACVCSLYAASDPATPALMTVRYREGSVHGFLLLSTMEGVPIAAGDLVQSVRGKEITTRTTFHFKDGSLQEETAVFSQRRSFRLIGYHMVQKGPSFPHPMDLSAVTSTGQVVVHTADDKGKDNVFTDHMKLPPDLANGLVPTLLKNIGPDVSAMKVPMLVATPKPRLVQLAISAQAEEPFSIAGAGRKAKHYVIKIEIGGIAGAVAPIFGKQPPDINVWILGGDMPAFVKSESLSYIDGPMWRTELAAPIWPKAGAPDSKK
jgi:hypothetical protein